MNKNLKVYLNFGKDGIHTKDGSNRLQTIKNLSDFSDIHFSKNGTYGPTWDANAFDGQGGYKFLDSENASIVSDSSFTDLYENDHTIIYVMERQKNWTGALLANNTDSVTLDQFPQLSCAGYGGGGTPGYAAQRTPLDFPMIYVTVNSPDSIVTNYIDKSDAIKVFTGSTGHTSSGLVDTICIGRKASDSTAKVVLNKFLMFKGAMTKDEVHEAIDYVRTLVNVPELHRPVNVVLDGNSLVMATGIAEDMFPTYVPKKLFLGQHCFPLTALGGATTPDLIERMNQFVNPQVRAGIDNFLFIWEGSNHLNTVGVTPQQACDALKVYAEIGLKTFSKVLIGNCLPRKASASGGSGRTDFETDRLSLNTLLSGIATDDIIIVDIAATGNGIGDIGDVTGANYNDGTHLSTLGSAIASQIVADVIKGLI